MHVREEAKGALSLPHGRGSGRGKLSILVAAPQTRAAFNYFLEKAKAGEITTKNRVENSVVTDTGW